MKRTQTLPAYVSLTSDALARIGSLAKRAAGDRLFNTNSPNAGDRNHLRSVLDVTWSRLTEAKRSIPPQSNSTQ